jgi:hypothetical protein
LFQRRVWPPFCEEIPCLFLWPSLCPVIACTLGVSCLQAYLREVVVWSDVQRYVRKFFSTTVLLMFCIYNPCTARTCIC